jgi:hypothetical protein
LNPALETGDVKSRSEATGFDDSGDDRTLVGPSNMEMQRRSLQAPRRPPASDGVPVDAGANAGDAPSSPESSLSDVDSSWGRFY